MTLGNMNYVNYQKLKILNSILGLQKKITVTKKSKDIMLLKLRT